MKKLTLTAALVAITATVTSPAFATDTSATSIEFNNHAPVINVADVTAGEAQSSDLLHTVNGRFFKKKFYGHRGFGHRRFGHKGFRNHGYGHRSFGNRGFGHNSFGHGGFGHKSFGGKFKKKSFFGKFF